LIGSGRVLGAGGVVCYVQMRFSGIAREIFFGRSHIYTGCSFKGIVWVSSGTKLACAFGKELCLRFWLSSLPSGVYLF